MTFQNQAGQRLECDGPLECSDISVVLALPLGHSRQSAQFGKPCNGIRRPGADSARTTARRRTLTSMSDQESAATEPRWTSEAAEKWLSRVDGLERSGAPIRELLLERADLQPGERVLMWDADQDPPQRPQRERCIPAEGSPPSILQPP
jgi:hypothetical protein